jgi:Na+/proline symporter
MVVRALGDSVRVYVAAIPLVVVTGWSEPTTVVVVATAVALATVAYTWAGGLKAVIWVDVMQMGLYTLAAIATVAVAASLAGGVANTMDAALEAGKLRVVDWGFSLTRTYTFMGGMIGGALLSAASHGTDHLIVQRLLATRALKDARRALVGSGILVIAQFAVFLLVGTFLWAAGVDDGSASSDKLFPTFIVEHLPSGVSGLVVAGILAAAMSTVSSSLNSLASAATHDFYAPITGRRDPRHLLKVGRWATLGWALVLLGGALSFVLGSTEQPAVELALSIASITYGALLGAYILAGMFGRVQQFDAMLAILVASATMVVVVLVKPGPFGDLAWPWYVPLGTAVTIAVGVASSLARRGTAVR